MTFRKRTISSGQIKKEICNMPKELRIIDGVEIELDREIADLICLLNEMGFKTTGCCSGIKSDHPYNEYPDGYHRYYDTPYIALDIGPNLDVRKDDIFKLTKWLNHIGNIHIMYCPPFHEYPVLIIKFLNGSVTKERHESENLRNLKIFFGNVRYASEGYTRKMENKNKA